MVTPLKQEYEVIDNRIKPDARGELGGTRIIVRGAKRFVRMSARQAQYYIEQGALALPVAASKEEPKWAAPAKKAS